MYVILAISDQYTTFICFKFFNKWLPATILDDRKSFSITFLAISDQYAKFYFCLEILSRNGRRRLFWINENHFRSHFSPFHINTHFVFKFHKMTIDDNFDDRKSLSIAFLTISDQYATFIFLILFSQNGRWRPFWTKSTFDHISRHFRSIRNFLFFFIFKMVANFTKLIGTSLYSRSVATSNMKLIGAFLIKLWSAQAFSSYFHKMASGGHFGFPIFSKIYRVLPL